MGVEGWRDWEGEQAVKGEGEKESEGGREGDGEGVCITLGNIGSSSIGNKLFSLGCFPLDIFTFHPRPQC